MSGISQPPGTQISSGQGVLVPVWQSWLQQLWNYVTTAITNGGLGANPAVKTGLSAVNGTAVTYLRSDAAPAIDQSISPSWTSVHTFQKGLVLPRTTVAALPTGSAGLMYIVTDAAAPTYLGALTGGGATVTPVMYNGSAWVSV